MSMFVPSSILGNLSCLARELLGACCWLRVVSVHSGVTLTEALNFLSSQQMEVCRLHGWKIPQHDFSHFKWNCLSSFPRGGWAWKESGDWAVPVSTVNSDHSLLKRSVKTGCTHRSSYGITFINWQGKHTCGMSWGLGPDSIRLIWRFGTFMVREGMQIKVR